MRASQPWRTIRARVLRSRSTSAEAKLWACLRNRQIGGHKFVRQAPVGPYFVDFLCRQKKLVVELDGATHGSDDQIKSDAIRAAGIAALGFRIIRIWNGDVYDNIDGVLETILASLAD